MLGEEKQMDEAMQTHKGLCLLNTSIIPVLTPTNGQSGTGAAERTACINQLSRDKGVGKERIQISLYATLLLIPEGNIYLLLTDAAAEGFGSCKVP